MIPVYQPYLQGREKEYVNQCLDTSWISSKGEFIGRFEQEFANYVKSPFATSVANGTVALHLALDALGITVGDEVIVPTFTYIASVNTIAQSGATPVFVDSLETTWQIDPEDVLRKITPKTKAVMAVHLYGLPCDMDALVRICKDKGIYLIEDSAEAFGSTYRGQHVGTFGDVGTFSFFGNKTITTGEGGMVIFNDEKVYRKALHLRSQGVSAQREYWHDILAYNYRMTNICAAIGLAQLEQIDEILVKKRKLAAVYAEYLAGLPLRCHENHALCEHSYWMCSILLDRPQDREPLRQYLRENGVETRPFFYPAHVMPVFHQDRTYPIAESLAARGINLPSWPGMSTQDQQTVINAIKSFFNQAR